MTMKKRLILAILFLSGLLSLSSCLKNDPDENPTVYYAYQEIPNINEFMPLKLINAFSDYLYYGDEPPKIEGVFIADAISITDVFRSPESMWMMTPTPMEGKQYFRIHDQHKGIAKIEFKYPKGNPGEYTFYVERSDPDSTYQVVTANPEFFINDSTIAPVYFKDGNYQKENFNTVYIMGKDPYFTAYYYEIRDIKSKADPLNAVIISGKVDKEISVVNDTVNHTTDTIELPIIRDLKWCIETMKYYKEGTSISQIINAGFLPSKGDAMLLKNDGVVHTGEFYE